MDPIVLVISVAVLASVAMIFASLSTGGGAKKSAMSNRLEVYRESPQGQSGEEEGAEEQKGSLKKRSYSGLPVLSVFLAQFGASEKVAIELERAGLPLRVGEYYMIRWGVAVLFFIVPLIVSLSLFTLLIALGTGFAGYMLPAMWLGGKKSKRIKRLEAQLVDMLGLVANSLKSGYGLMQSFEFAAKQMDAPMALELRRMLREANLGMSAEGALNALGDRVGSKDLDMVLTAINIQRSVGGNLAEILEKVAHTMRERERIRGEINTLTSQQKMTGIVIGGLPVFIFVVFMVLNPDYTSLLFTEMVGRIMLGLAVVLEIVGYFSIKRIMAIDV